MLADLVPALACPVCRLPLTAADGALVCAHGHSYDVARQGYANLLPGGAHTGTADTPAMVAARQAFLDAGHFTPVALALAGAAERAIDATPGIVLDVGAGTGHYLAFVLERLPDRLGLALDISKHAARRAARAHPRAAAVVCDAWGALPVRDGAAALVLSVFAPRNPAEFARVLAPGGALVTVTPTGRHLGELVDALGLVTVDARKDERLAGSLGARFEQAAAEEVERPFELAHADVAAVVAMGPSARHIGAEELAARIAALPESARVTLSVTVAIWRPH